MKKEDLTEYIGIVADMENEIYMKEQLLPKIKASIKSNLTEPDYSAVNDIPDSYRPISYPPEPKTDIYESEFEDHVKYGTVFSIVSPITFILCFIYMEVGLEIAFLDILIFILFFASIIFFIVGIVRLIIGLPKKRKYAEQQRELDEYKEQIRIIDRKNEKNLAASRGSAEYRRYVNSVEVNNARLKTEYECKKLVLKNEVKKLERSLSESKSRLDKMYDIGIIYPKYRNMTMTNTIYEYLKSGRCESLEGHEGAYNILEQEMRLDRIIVQLDNVVNQLDKIRENQYMLYSALQGINYNITTFNDSVRIISSKLDSALVDIDDITSASSENIDVIKEIADNSAISVYCSKRTKAELYYMNRMKYLAGEYDGSSFN